MQSASVQTTGLKMTREELGSASDPHSDQPILTAGLGCWNSAAARVTTTRP